VRKYGSHTYHHLIIEVHKYFPDFYIKYIDKNKTTKESLIEVKPKRQVNGPKTGKRVTKKQSC